MGGRNYNLEFDELQRHFFQTKNERCLTDIYRLLAELSAKYIKAYARKKNIFIDDVAEKAHDVATTIIDRKFYRRAGGEIKKITTYIYFDCLHELVKDAQREACRLSFDCDDRREY